MIAHLKLNYLERQTLVFLVKQGIQETHAGKVRGYELLTRVMANLDFRSMKDVFAVPKDDKRKLYIFRDQLYRFIVEAVENATKIPTLDPFKLIALCKRIGVPFTDLKDFDKEEESKIDPEESVFVSDEEDGDEEEEKFVSPKDNDEE